MTDTSASAAPAPAGRRSALPVWAVTLLASLFGLFYAYALWTAVGFLAQQAAGDDGLTGYGWFVLFLPVVFPAIAFGGALALAWRRPLVPFVLVMLTGLVLVAVFWLNVFALAVTSTAIYNAS